MKYGNLNLGQVEAIVNKLGGMEGVRRLLSGEMTVSVPAVRITVSPDAPFEHHADWDLASDVEVAEGELELELAEFLKEGESHISSDELVKRAEALDAMYGQRHAEALLRNQKEIPKEFRRYYLIFPGTVRRHPNGHFYVPYVYWNRECWVLNFSWLGCGFLSGARLVRARK